MDAVVIANWKMNGSAAGIETFGRDWQALDASALNGVQVVVCPPFPYLSALRAAMPGMSLGAQDCSSQSEGAFTGEVAGGMLAECGCDWVIVGHSERRQYHGETDAMVASKAQAAMAAGLTAVVCVGESLQEREAGRHGAVVEAQLAGSLADLPASGLVIAYEPVWAIGTGVSASPEQAQSMHRWIRECLVAKFGSEAEQISVIYGGSVKPQTAGELFACEDIDGALVGGASLEANSFFSIAAAAGDAGRT